MSLRCVCVLAQGSKRKEKSRDSSKTLPPSSCCSQVEGVHTNREASPLCRRRQKSLADRNPRTSRPASERRTRCTHVWDPGLPKIALGPLFSPSFSRGETKQEVTPPLELLFLREQERCAFQKLMFSSRLFFSPQRFLFFLVGSLFQGCLVVVLETFPRCGTDGRQTAAADPCSWFLCVFHETLTTPTDFRWRVPTRDCSIHRQSIPRGLLRHERKK